MFDGPFTTRRAACSRRRPPYWNVFDAVRCWPETATAIAARIEGGRVEILAPHGVGDLCCADRPADTDVCPQDGGLSRTDNSQEGLEAAMAQPKVRRRMMSLPGTERPSWVGEIFLSGIRMKQTWFGQRAGCHGVGWLCLRERAMST